MRDLFAVSIAHVSVGEMTVDSIQDAETYAARMTFRTTGLAGLLRQVGFVGETTGTIRRGKDGPARFRPLRHREEVDTGRHANRTEVDFSGARPVTLDAGALGAGRLAASVDGAAPSARPGPGSIDPVTLILSVMHAEKGAALCDLDVNVFDGLRTTRAILGPPRPGGGLVVCDGTYIRTGGFSAAEMDERQSFRFTLTYVLDADGTARLDRVETDTLYGKGRLKRR